MGSWIFSLNQFLAFPQIVVSLETSQQYFSLISVLEIKTPERKGYVGVHEEDKNFLHLMFSFFLFFFLSVLLV